MPQNELTTLNSIKKYRGTICTKNTEKQIFKTLYNQRPEGDSARQTRTQHLNSNIPNHSQWGKRKKQYSFTLSTSIQTTQLTLSNIHTQDET